MLRLLTFGGLRVLRADGSATDLANQRRRIAVLAIVAAAAPLGVSRERLMFLLWPDADADKGRHALNQIVYNLRRELGASPIAGVSELSLLTDVMSADLIEFRDAIARGDHASAASLYTGPFLNDFAVPGAGEFERWAEEERTRTMRQAMSAIDKLAIAAAASNDLSARVHWTQRLVELDPLSARRALDHMHALALHGDRDAAIAYGRRYEVLARDDGDDVDPAVGAEVERLRGLPTVFSRPDAEPAAEVPIAPESTAPRQELPALHAPTIAAATVIDTHTTTPAGKDARRLVPLVAPSIAPTVAPSIAPSSARRGTWRWRLIAGLAVAAAAAAGALVWARSRPRLLAMRVGDRMLLADAQLPAADSANARALTFALQSALQQSTRVSFVSPAAIADALRRMGRDAATSALPDSTAAEVAEREGARYVVSLSVTPSTSGRVVSLNVLDPSTRASVRTYTTTTTGDDVLDAIDVVARKLRRDLGDSRVDVGTAIPLPRATTPSLEALRLYAGATAAFNRAQYKDARALYDGALVLDSGFAAAHAGLAYIDYVYNNPRAGDPHMQRALALSDRLPSRERLLIQAVAARGANDWPRAATLHRAYLIRYPQDYDVYAQLAYDLMRARSSNEALEAFDSLQAHRTLHAGDLLNLASVRTQLGKFAEARDAHVAAVHLDTAFLTRAMQNEQIGRVLLTLGFTDSARTVHSVMLLHQPQDQARGHRALAYVDLYEGRYASAIEHLRKAIAINAVEADVSLSEIRDRDLLANALMDLGRIADARDQLLVAAQKCIARRTPPQALYWTGKPLARLGELTLARALLDSARARTRATDKAEQAATTALEAEIQVATGHAADGAVSAARALALDDSLTMLVDTHAFALERSGALAEARDIYTALSGRLRGAVEIEGQQMARMAPLAVARIDLQLGRGEDARRALGAFVERWPRADANLPMLTTLRARIDATRRP